MSVMAKLLAIQSQLIAPKEQYNSFGKYSYRNCESILEALKPLLAKHGAAVILRDDLRSIDGRFYVCATATLFDAETGESVEATAFAREEETKKGMDGSQITGAASSYARKYALGGLFCVDDGKDADSDEKPQESKAKTELETCIDTTKKLVYKLCQKDKAAAQRYWEANIADDQHDLNKLKWHCEVICKRLKQMET